MFCIRYFPHIGKNDSLWCAVARKIERDYGAVISSEIQKPMGEGSRFGKEKLPIFRKTLCIP